jgi:hypothetical protein
LRASGRFGLTFRIRVLVLLEKKSNFREKNKKWIQIKNERGAMPEHPQNQKMKINGRDIQTITILIIGH